MADLGFALEVDLWDFLSDGLAGGRGSDNIKREIKLQDFWFDSPKFLVEVYRKTRKLAEEHFENKNETVLFGPRSVRDAH